MSQNEGHETVVGNPKSLGGNGMLAWCRAILRAIAEMGKKK